MAEGVFSSPLETLLNKFHDIISPSDFGIYVYKWEFWPDSGARGKVRRSENICINLLEIMNMDDYHEYSYKIKYDYFFFHGPQHM